MAQSSVDEKSVGSETYGFDAIRGIQAGREFYVGMCPLKIIPKLFIFNDHDIPPELPFEFNLVVRLLAPSNKIVFDN